MSDAAPIENKATEQATAAPDASIEVDEEELGYKVFVGNLDFATTEARLEEYFGTIGKVKKSHIIKRGTRSLGYGFVTYESKEDASKASAEFNKKELDGRELDVQLAKPKSESTRATTATSGNGAAGGEKTNGGFHHRGSGRRRTFRGGFRGRGRGRGAAAGFSTSGGEGGEEGEERKAASQATNTAEGGKRGNGRGGLRGGRSGRGGRGGRPAPRVPRGEPSETVLFVTNLPFSLDDEGLKKVFANYTVLSAKVVRGPKNRSKGFGFVELKSHEEQTGAIESLKNIEVEGRKLVLKVARVDQREVEEHNAEAEEHHDSEEPSASAAATDVPATTTTTSA